MRYSSIVKWQYWTAIILLLVLSIHLIFRILPGSYDKSLEYNQVRENYGNNLYVVTLTVLLFVALFHGFNGLRVILYEFSPRLGRIATPIILALGVVFAILGLLTIAGIYIFP